MKSPGISLQGRAGSESKPTAVRDASLRLDPEARKRVKEAQQTYGRGRRIATSRIKDKKLRGNLSLLEQKYRNATLKAKDAEILLENESGYLEPEGELERTYKVRQDDLRQDVAIETAKKGFELKLEGLGPYAAEYSRNGRDLLLFGRKGHVAATEWREGKLGCELQLGETLRDARWLHNNQYFAVSQRKYVYIYDYAGVELHCLKKHSEVSHMEFLPYHFLLATVVRYLAKKKRKNQSWTLLIHISGHGRISQISGHFYWAIGGGDSNSSRVAHCFSTESP